MLAITGDDQISLRGHGGGEDLIVIDIVFDYAWYLGGGYQRHQGEYRATSATGLVPNRSMRCTNDPLDKTDPTGNQIAEGALVAGCVAQPEICAVVAVAAVLGGGAAI